MTLGSSSASSNKGIYLTRLLKSTSLYYRLPNEAYRVLQPKRGVSGPGMIPEAAKNVRSPPSDITKSGSAY